MNVSCPECRSVFRVDPDKVPRVGVRARCSVCGGVIIVGGAGSIDEEFGSPVPATPPTLAIAEPAEAEPVLVGATPGIPDAIVAVEAPTAGAVPPRQPTPGRSATPAIPRPLTPPAGVFGRPGSPKGPPDAPSAPPKRPVVFSPRVGAPGPAGPSTAPSAGAPSAPRPAISPRPVAGSPVPVRNSSVAPGRAPINPFLANDPNAKARRLARALISDLVTYFPERRDEGLRAGTLRDLFADEIKKSYEEYVEQIGREFADSTSHFKDALNEILAGGQSVF
ncbi:MAG TPA: zinc-ribbon domain-containing protein [Gemmatimonadaceae bacterium]|nr:zinc-ribbon domain-containing protein [Gemmatimonadaceae bacterium]